MSTQVAVRYATAAGSTAGIAERITTVLRRWGCEASCRPAGTESDLPGVDALVLGSAVHDMAWLPEALAAARRAADNGLPVWCFSVGAVEPKGPLTRLLARLEVERVRTSFPAALAVRDHRVFRGVVRMEGVPWWGRLFYRVVGGRPGDHRDWPAVEQWAARIAVDLAADVTGAGGDRR